MTNKKKETIQYKKGDSTTMVLPEGVAMYTLNGTDVDTVEDTEPEKDTRNWTRRGHWVTWGKTNKFPIQVMADLRESTIAKRILSQRAKVHVGAGLVYYTIDIDPDGRRKKRPLYIPEIEEFLEANNAFAVQKAIVEDLETFYNAVPFFKLNLGGDRIAGYGYKKMIHCRWGTDSETSSEIDRVYYSFKWPNPNPKNEDDVKVYPIFDQIEPLSEPLFTKPISYSTSDECTFYELAVWDSIRQNGWMAIDKLVPKLKKHIFENQAILKYHVKIPYDYWHRKYGTECWEGKTMDERNAAINEELANMDKFLRGVENSGKSFISLYGHDPVTGKPYPGFEILAIDNKLKSEDYLPDATAAYSAICFAMGYDPTLIGAGLIDKRNSGGSGSDKRESLANLQSSMVVDRFVSLEPLRIITTVNKWNEKFKDQLDGKLIHWGYLDSDTSHTLDQAKPKAGEEDKPKQSEEILNS